MSPVIPSCVVCGWVVVERPGVVSWINQFRALIPDPQAGIVLTGVGLHDDPFSPTPFAPRHPNARWDQPGYDNRDPEQAAEFNQIILVLRHHVVFHESCFRLLETVLQLDQRAFTRLSQICSSLPFPTRGTSMSWGHDYGGLVTVDTEYAYPWEDRYSDLVLQDPELWYTADPVHGTEAMDILSQRPSGPPQPRQWPTTPVFIESPEPESAGRDPFALLPPEICTMIASELSVTDYLSSRLATRSMWPVFHYQTWWREKFFEKTGGWEDRSWLVEAWEAPERLQNQDWRFLYRRTRHTQLSPGLKNRKRIWRLLQDIPHIVSLEMDSQQDPPAETPTTSTTTTAATTRQVPRVQARLRPPRRGYESADGFDGDGCREQYSRKIDVPADAASITVHMVRLGDADYLCGLEVAGQQDETVFAGYQSSLRQQVCFDGKLRGFIAAVGCRGFHAIQLVTCKGWGKSKTVATTAWLGDIEAECVTTERLAWSSGDVTGIEARFDGCKMVSLTMTSGDGQPTTSQDLRTSAFWYPKIPEPHLHLNNNPGLSMDGYREAYQPLFWTHFGGPGGSRLSRLTGMSAMLLLRGGIGKVDFYFDQGTEGGMSKLTLGRRRAGIGSKMMHFAIDGPGGERIRDIDVVHRVTKSSSSAEDEIGPMRPVFLSFRISTNWDRSCLFKMDLSLAGPLIADANEQTFMQRVPIEPGTTITGFYAEQQPELGFGVAIVGVISEKVGEGEEQSVASRPKKQKRRR